MLYSFATKSLFQNNDSTSYAVLRSIASSVCKNPSNNEEDNGRDEILLRSASNHPLSLPERDPVSKSARCKMSLGLVFLRFADHRC